MTFHASFPKTIAHLRATFTPEEYLALMNRIRQSRRLFSEKDEVKTFWNRLPIYLFARCPLCGGEFTSPADTHSLFEWLTTPNSGRYIFSWQLQKEGCFHFTGVQTFIHLNNQVPKEIKYFSGECGDIPIVLPELLRDEFHASAVMHSLPICRVEGNEFVPSYSLYTVTYYSDAPGEARPRSYDLRFPGEGDEESGPLPLFDSSARIRREPLVADLRHWVERGKLHWLDLEDPALPLKYGPAGDFPYAGIQGFGVPYLYAKTPKPRWRWLDRNWHPDGVVREWGRNRVLLRPP
ncbi:MAG: hypothetical protein KDE24_08610 [Caldilinea sp.]|nr:hypothetical protein [Caldilinea sp.]